MNIKKIIREEINNELDWINDVSDNPFDFYFNNGYTSLGIVFHHPKTAKQFLNYTDSLGYYRNWDHDSEFVKYPHVIWVTHYPNSNSIRVEYSNTNYLFDEMPDNELIIDNPIKNINESDELDWIRDVDSYIELQPNTVYYFNPNIKGEDLQRFINLINPINSNIIRRLQVNLDNINSGNHDSLKYFVTSGSLRDIMGWCSETEIMDAMTTFYSNCNLIDVKKDGIFEY